MGLFLNEEFWWGFVFIEYYCVLGFVLNIGVIVLSKVVMVFFFVKFIVFVGVGVGMDNK